MRGTCFICGKPAMGRFGIRLRKSKTRAIWAPETQTFLCHRHSICGAEVEIRYRETDTGRVVMRVLHNGDKVAETEHEIREQPLP